MAYEQTFRENSLKPFEYAVKVGKTNALMAAFVRWGGMRSCGSYAMLTQVVRNEWGFRGTVITDYYQVNNDLNSIDECVRAGCTQILHPDGKVSWMATKNVPTTKYYVHKSAKDFVYAYVESKSFAATAQGLEKDELVGVSTGSAVFAWWIPLLALVNVGVLTIVGALSWSAIEDIVSIIKDKKQKEQSSGEQQYVVKDV